MEQITNSVALLGMLIILFNLSAPYLSSYGKSRRKIGMYAGFLGCDPCPTGTIPSVGAEVCYPDWQRFTRVFFQKRTIPQDSFTAANIVTQLAWTTKLTAVDDTKIVPTPLGRLKRMAFTPGEVVRTTDTPTGQERALGKVQGDKVTFILENISPAQYSALKTLFCYPLVVYFATADNVILSKEITPTTNYQGFPVYGTPVINTPEVSAELVMQPRNFMVEFTLDDVNWYAYLKEFKTTFANLI